MLTAAFFEGSSEDDAPWFPLHISPILFPCPAAVALWCHPRKADGRGKGSNAQGQLWLNPSEEAPAVWFQVPATLSFSSKTCTCVPAVWYICNLSPFAGNTKQMLHLLRGVPSLLSVSCSSFHKSVHVLKPFLRPHLHVSLSCPFFTGFSFSLCIYTDVHRLNLVLLPAVPSWFGCLVPVWSPATAYTQETHTMRVWVILEPGFKFKPKSRWSQTFVLSPFLIHFTTCLCLRTREENCVA